MNLRYKILEAVSKSPGAPASEICEVIEHDKQKTTWSVRDCAKAGLLSVRRDDVTGLPGYTLTDAGKARLAEGPASKQGSNMQQEAARKDDALPEPASKPEGASPGERDEELNSLRRQVAEHASALAIMDEQVMAARAVLVPLMHGELDDGSATLKEVAERVSAGMSGLVGTLVDKDAELFRQATLVVELRAEIARLQSENIALKTLNDAMPGFGAAFNAGTQHAGFIMRAAKRKPMTIKSEEKARAAALSAIKAGAQRAEVFALVPVGCARKAATWEPA